MVGNDEASRRPRHRVLLVVSGAGGAGKSTVVNRLLQLRPELHLSRSWTTRDRRPGEAEDAYVWVDRPRFEERVRAGGFLEWTEFPGNGRLYGTPSLDDAPDRDTVLEIELDGARQVRSVEPDAVLVMIVAPSGEHRERRLRARGDDPASVTRRMAVGAEEERVGRDLADHVVVNDDVARSAAEVAGILDGHRADR